MSRLRKISGATWIALANMVLTLLIGVFFALYLKGRDEEFALRLKDREELLQKQLIELQAETERRANIANIQFVSECSDPLSCRGHVALKNLSQTTAKNVKVVLFVRHFDNRWSNGLNSIDLFSIKTSPASLQISSEVKTINTY